MKKYKIYKWGDIKDCFVLPSPSSVPSEEALQKYSLLLGNGASIAVHDGLSYRSLYKEACRSGALDGNLQQLFEHFNTTNFEVILRLLLNANLINGFLNMADDKTAQAYREVKTALVRTVMDVHPKYDDVEPLLRPIADFMKNFRRVLCLNYDLLVYWAMLSSKKYLGPWFKDGFTEANSFNKNYDKFLYNPRHPAKGATMVFYPHGSLFLATDFSGDAVKLSRSDEDCLLETISSKWGQGDRIKDYMPLFISEGDPKEKLSRIMRSNYLDTVYDSELSRLDESLVIYGWSFDKRDRHIMDALAQGSLKEIAISVHKGSTDRQSWCDEVEQKIRKKSGLSQCEIYFFDAESNGCWIY